MTLNHPYFNTFATEAYPPNFELCKMTLITSSEHTLKNNMQLMQNKGLTVIKSDEYFPKLKFFDVGALVYFAKIIK